MPCARTGQAAWLSSKLINLILSYFRDIFFVNTDAEAVRERRAGEREVGQHPHPFNSYGLKAEDSQVVGRTRTQRDTLKQFHLHFSLRLDRGTRGENSTGQDRKGQERSCSLTVSGFMLPPCNVIKNMSASALDGAPVASGKLRVFTQCEHTVVLVVACHHRKAWTVYTPFPHSHSLFHSVPGQRRGPVHALPLPSGMTDC